MLKINKIIREVILNFLNEDYNMNYHNLTIKDLADILGQLHNKASSDDDKYSPDDDKTYAEIYTNMLMDEYKKGGNEAVVKIFKAFANQDIYPIRNGRFSMTPQVTPQNYKWNVDESVNDRLHRINL